MNSHGHVDHGKTSVLDVLKKQMLFLENLGIINIWGVSDAHEKINNAMILWTWRFEMRARGSKLTDIVILVVAADDGVKPPTESIKHAKAAKVRIVVAINKCDLPEADPQKIKNQLLEYELLAEIYQGHFNG